MVIYGAARRSDKNILVIYDGVKKMWWNIAGIWWGQEGVIKILVIWQSIEEVMKYWWYMMV